MTSDTPPAPDPGRAHLTLALYEPDIPQNCGTMLRMCACLGIAARIIEPAGFPTSDRHFKRAALDYLPALALARDASFAAFRIWCEEAGARLVLLTTKAALPYTQVAFRPGDVLLVGRESAGVPPLVHDVADVRVTIPMRPGLRSLNVAVAAAMVAGEALRQIGERGRGSHAVSSPVGK